MTDVPKSPWRAPVSQCQYCTRSGSFTPSTSRRLASCSGLACSPAIEIAGSPGTRCSRRNTTNVARNSVGISTPSRCSTNRLTVLLLSALAPEDRDVDLAVQVRYEPAHLLVEGVDVGLVEERTDQGVVLRELHDLGEGLGPFRLIGALAGGGEVVGDARRGVLAGVV